MLVILIDPSLEFIAVKNNGLILEIDSEKDERLKKNISRPKGENIEVIRTTCSIKKNNMKIRAGFHSCLMIWNGRVNKNMKWVKINSNPLYQSLYLQYKLKFHWEIYKIRKMCELKKHFSKNRLPKPHNIFLKSRLI